MKNSIPTEQKLADMQVFIKILVFGFLLSIQNVFGNSSFNDIASNDYDSLRMNIPIDSVNIVDHIWPDCPEIKGVQLIELDAKTFLIKWEVVLSERVEYAVEFREQDKIVQNDINNSGVYVFQLDENWSLNDLKIDITTKCYFENRNQPLTSDINTSDWKDLINASTKFCDSYEELISKDELKSFIAIGTKFPKDVNFTFEVCADEDCKPYNHAVSSSTILSKGLNAYEYVEPKLFTKYGNFDCSSRQLMLSDPCDGIVVEELENCLYSITYPDSIAPVCDLGLYSHNVTHSLCGNPTGKIIVRPYKGNKPYYYSWSTGDEGFENELSGLLPGTYNVTVTDVTGCQVESSIIINESTSVQFHVNGGDGGLQESVILPPGMELTWKFNPHRVTDQCIISGQGLIVDTGPITNGTQAQCVNNSSCFCSSVFMGDYNSGDELPITSGTANKSGTTYAIGDITVPSDGQLNFTVIGANCGSGTGWNLRLQCVPQTNLQNDENNDISYVQHSQEVQELINSNQITFEQFNKDSISYYKPLNTKSKLRHLSRNNTSTILDFRCSGHVDSPYTIRLENNETGEIYQCDIIDEVSCPVCSEETDGCDLISYTLEADPWDPICRFEWEVENGVISQLEILNDVGHTEVLTTDQNGIWEFDNGKSYRVIYTLENDTLSTTCSFEIECPKPDLPPINESICRYFDQFEVSLENENSLYFSSGMQLSFGVIEELNLLLSQIDFINISLGWGLGPSLNDYTIYSSGNNNSANLFQLDPENMTFVLDDYDMQDVWDQITQGVIYSSNQRVLRYELTITDIDGKVTKCRFEAVVDFPEDEKEDENPLCLTCGDGVYDTRDDLRGFSLEDGIPYTKDLLDKTIHIYGFPIRVTKINNELGKGEGILSLPFYDCKVLAVDIVDIKVVEFTSLEKQLWVKSGQIIPNDLYPGDLPDFEVAPDFVYGAEICVPKRNSNDANGDGINDNTNLDKYGFDANGNHMNGTKFDNNGFDVNGNYMGCPRIDDPNLDCTEYNEDGCNRDGLDETGKPCPNVDSEQWDEFVDKFSESSDSVVSSIICEFANEIQENKNRKQTECDSLRSIIFDYISTTDLTEEEKLLIKGENDKFLIEGMSEYFSSVPQIPSYSVGGRNDIIENIEVAHVDLYYCDLELGPLQEKASSLSSLCSIQDNSEIEALISQTLGGLSNLDKQRLMLDENAFNDWIENIIREYLKENHDLIVKSELPEFINFELFNQPVKAYYQGPYTSIASIDDAPFILNNFSLKDAIDFEYSQGFEEINGVHRGFYVAQLGKYNQKNYSSLGGQEPVFLQNVNQSSIYSIYLVNFRFYVDKPAEVDAYVELSDPKSDRKIYFSALDVKYNPEGIEKARMELATSISKFKISNSARGTIKKGPKTYLDFDCSGVQEFGLEGEVEFCDNIIVPMQQIEDKNDFERHDSTYFKLGFETIFTEWLEFETRIEAKSPFAIAGKEDIIWKVGSLNFDNSSSSSQFSSTFKVPDGFQSEFTTGKTLGPGWKGFYCDRLSAVLPALTKSDNGDRYTAARVENLLIDKYGITCSAEVSANILGLGKPNMKSEGESTGWSMSIDYFRIDAVQNSIVGGGIRGKILTSLFKDDDNSALDYSALILPGQKYKFSVSPKVDLEVPLLVATAEIKRSAIDVVYDASEESFTAQARFTGNLKIDIGSEKTVLPYLTFTDLTVNNKAPYISSGKWALKSNSSSGNNNNTEEDSGDFKGFRFSIENLNFEVCEGGPLLSSTVNLGFGWNGSNGEEEGNDRNSNLTISGDMGLKSKFSPYASGLQGFTFEKVMLNGFSVRGNISEAVKDIDVRLCWDEDHPEYGDTFYGSGKASILNFGEVGIAAQFGKKDAEKYFFVDAFAEIPTIPIGGPVGINMIGLGVSKNMKIQNAASGNGDPSIPETESEACSPPACASNFGQTYTGFIYRYDPAQALGIRASVGLGMVEGSPGDFIEGAAGIDLTFNDNGGISRIGFFGEATILASFPGSDKLTKMTGFINEPPVSKLDSLEVDTSSTLDLNDAKPNFSSSLPLMARVEGAWDFDNGDFDLSAGAFLDWGVLKGAGRDNALVLGKVHFGSKGWNISLGTPSSPSGVKLNLGIVNASLKTYFMAGNPLSEPWRPYLPPKVKAFFGDTDDFQFLDNMPANGAGFAFGIHFAAGFDISVPILGSAYADLMLGTDIAMINGFRCNGNPIGFGSGWYAMGQSYLYAGAGLRILGVDLIKGEAGILMNAGLTNPSFFNGRLRVSGKFGIWPLKFKISGNIDVELGDKPNCDFYVIDQGEVFEILGDINIVESTYPITGAKKVSTDLSIFDIHYAVPMGEVVQLTYPDTLASGEIRDQNIEYILDVSRIEVISSSTGTTLQSFNPSDDGLYDGVFFNRVLPTNDSIIVKITYNVNVKVPDSDSFIPVISQEILEYNFTTGPLELRFDPKNIKSVWPENGMNNFYLDTRHNFRGKKQGLINFKYRFPWEIFETPGLQVRSAIYKGDNSQPIVDTEIDPQAQFNAGTDIPSSYGNGYVYFELPDEMELGKQYKVSIYAISDTSDIQIPLMEPIHFRTSLYPSLEDKFAESDSMYYVEASPRIGVEDLGYQMLTYTCGFEYNLVSNEDALEGWDKFDAKWMKFSPICGFDINKPSPKINSDDFVDCEITENDQPPSWDPMGNVYELTSISDILDIGDLGGLLNENNESSVRAESTVRNVSKYEIVLRYRGISLMYKYGHFKLKSCN